MTIYLTYKYGKLLSDKSITGAKEFFNFLNFRIGGWPDEIKRA